MKTRILLAAVAVLGLAAAIIFPLTAANSKSGTDKASAAMVKHGEYLVTLGGCNDCHTPKAFSPAAGPYPDTTRLLSGHQANAHIKPVPSGVISMDGWLALTNADLTAWAGPWGVSFAANLTPDNITGIGAWTEQTFISALRTGKHMGAGRAILPPMPWQNLAQMNDDDLKAIFAYLKSLKPIENSVPLPVPPAMPGGK